MSQYKTLIVKQENSVLSVILNRPEVKNAFNDELIPELIDVFTSKATDESIRVAVITGNGDAFCAGGDINWMKKSASYTPEQNVSDAKKLGTMLSAINNFPRPVIGGVHGACLGGGLGLVSVCDYVISSAETFYSFSEVRLGLIPAVIGPFVKIKIGESNMRALFLTAERFPSARAFGLGLVHKVVEKPADIAIAVDQICKTIKECSPNALKVAKDYIHAIKEKSFDEQIDLAANKLAELRSSKEGQEGLSAFLEKRKPNWIK